MRLRPTALSIGGSSKKARRNRYQYKLVIPSKGVYRADRQDSKPYWMWQDSSGAWLAGEELSSPVTSTTPDVFEDKFIDVRWMSRERITRPGVHAWCIWSDTAEDWSQEPYEFSTEVDDYAWELAALTPGEVLRDGWFDPAMMSDEDFLQLEDNDDEEDDEAPPPPPPLQGIWRESPQRPPPPPPPPPPPGLTLTAAAPTTTTLPAAPTMTQEASRLPTAAPTTPPEASCLPRAAPTTPPEAFHRPSAFTAFTGPGASSSSTECIPPSAVPKCRWGRK